MADDLWNFIATGRDDLANVLGQAFPQEMNQTAYQAEAAFDPGEYLDQQQAINSERDNRVDDMWAKQMEM